MLEGAVHFRGRQLGRVDPDFSAAVRCFGYGRFRQDLQHPDAVVPAFCREHVFPRSRAAESLRHLLGRGLEMETIHLSSNFFECPNPKALTLVGLVGHIAKAFVSARAELPAEAVIQAGLRRAALTAPFAYLLVAVVCSVSKLCYSEKSRARTPVLVAHGTSRNFGKASKILLVCRHWVGSLGD